MLKNLQVAEFNLTGLSLLAVWKYN